MSGSFNSKSIKLSIHDQIAELQRKIQLLEGDKCAYYESSQSDIRRNKDSIIELRQENKRLYKKLSDAQSGDEQAIKAAFQNRGMEKAAIRNKSGKEAVRLLDQKVCDKVKKLNALKHRTDAHRRHLEELQLEYEKTQSAHQAKQHAADGAEEEAKNEGEEAGEHPQQNLRVLENRLEKAQLKCEEVEHMTRGYLKMKGHLQEDSLTYQSRLDGLEAEILRQRQELRELQVMHADAHLSKDAAKTELQRHEEQLYRERKERESILARYKEQAEERKAHADRVERRAQRTAVHPDELSSEVQGSATVVGEEHKFVSAYEEAFQHMREATGVSDAEEVVERYVAQGNTQKHLEQLKLENSEMLEQLKEEQDRLNTQFQEMKFSGEAKLSGDQQVLEECEAHLRKEQDRCNEAKLRLDWLTSTLNTAGGGVEQLRSKLHHVGLPKTETPLPEVDPSSEEYILELLKRSEQKLLLLQQELQGKDMGVIMKEMEEEEFHTSIEGKLPDHNTRIKLPQVQRQDPYEDEEDSEEDEGDVITRVMLKRESQMIIDSRTKRKTRMKKKKGKQ